LITESSSSKTQTLSLLAGFIIKRAVRHMDNEMAKLIICPPVIGRRFIDVNCFILKIGNLHHLHDFV